MPATVPMRGSSRRRTISEINMVPFIDVMLVLLIIFMVSAPMMSVGIVDLPTLGKSKQQPPKVIEVIVGKDEKLKMRVDGKNETSVAMSVLADRVARAQGGNAQAPVVISADKAVKYEAVVKVMDTLQRAGVQRVGLSVKTLGS
jgi:biopolymer transport protein TolR